MNVEPLLVDCGHYALSADASVAYARPSIDVLMESVADQYSDSALGIILTGGGYDGVKGLQKIQSNGGAILVQNPKTAQDSVLPQAIIDHGITQKTFDLEPLSKALLLQCRA